MSCASAVLNKQEIEFPINAGFFITYRLTLDFVCVFFTTERLETQTPTDLSASSLSSRGREKQLSGF